MSDGWYERLAALPLRIDRWRRERHEFPVMPEFTRVTTEIVLDGGAIEGRGEDVTYTAQDHELFPELDLTWRGDLGGFCDRVGALDLFTGEPAMPVSRSYRRWALESAALDLALRQAGVSLGDLLELPYRPVHFVVSTRLDVRPWLAVQPDLKFKLDPTPEWDAATMREMAARDCVRVLDFKAFYTGTPVDNPPDASLYETVIGAFPEAVIEDAGVTPETRALLEPLAGRLSWDAPIHNVTDVEALPWPARHLNIKPSRFGSLRALLECIAYGHRYDVALYGGGQFELGYGRGQIEALASLFYADGPNDVAPAVYHGEARAGLPASPLAPPAHPAGFSW